MFKVDRQDKEGSMYTTFIVETAKGEAQEFNVPVWDADDFEAKVNGFTNVDFNNFKATAGKSNARPSR